MKLSAVSALVSNAKKTKGYIKQLEDKIHEKENIKATVIAICQELNDSNTPI